MRDTNNDSFDEAPEWAARFNFEAHSPSGINRPTDLEFFEKTVARPEGVQDRANVNMAAGKAAESFAKDVVIHGESHDQALRAAVAYLHGHDLKDDIDAARYATIMDDVYEIPLTKEEKKNGSEPVSGTVLDLTLKHTAEGLAAATQGANRVTDGRWVSVSLEGVELPFIGEIDVEASGVVEIKTKWPRQSKSERGWAVNSLPQKPMPAHVWQCALYWKFLREQSENVSVKLVYANCKDWRVFDSVDCADLQEVSLTAALDRMRVIASTREKLMQHADSVQELLSMLSPDFSHWMWANADREYVARAHQEWGL